jgi:hypothetical protein
MAERRDAEKPIPSRRSRAALLALAVPAFVGLVAQAAIAQPPRAGAVPPRTRTAPRATAPRATPEAGPTTTAPAALTAAPPAAGPTAAVAAPDAGANVVEAKTLDGGTRVFKFKELDIEGRLKSPQLVYFLRRVRAEFSAGDLGHRTFMREMSETRKESSF